MQDSNYAAKKQKDNCQPKPNTSGGDNVDDKPEYISNRILVG